MTNSAPGVLTRFLLRLYEPLVMLLGLGFFVLLCLIWLPAALVLYHVLPRQRGIRVGRRVISFGARTYLRFMTLFCVCHFDLTELDKLRSEHGLVLVANHPSLLDILLLVSRLPQAVCIMKAALMENVLFGAAARLAGYIPNNGPLEVILHSCDELNRGAHLIIFPEGTRTGRFPLDRCGVGAALISARAEAPLQTLVIGFSSAYLGKAWPLWRRPRLPLSFWVRLGRRLAPSTDSAALTRDIETALKSGLAAVLPEVGLPSGRAEARAVR